MKRLQLRKKKSFHMLLLFVILISPEFNLMSQASVIKIKIWPLTV